MLRRILTTLTVAVFGLLAVPTLASAANPPYEAPSVTPATGTVAPIVDSGVASYTTDTALASTGAGFSLTTALLIGAIVLVVGCALVIVGNRMRKSTHN